MTTSTYSLISGSLPPGLQFTSSGTIHGSPDPVLNITRSKFVVRANTSDIITDNTFLLDVEGSDAPIWVTTSGYLHVGASGEPYALNNQWVDFQLSANPVEAPAGTIITYYIANKGGNLPPGLILSQSGRISGYLKDKLVPDGTVSTIGGYDSEPYDHYAYDHSGTYIGSATDTTTAGLPKIYQFIVTATDGVASSTQSFKIVVSSTDILKYNATTMPSDIVLPDPLIFTQPVQWVRSADLGMLRAGNNADLNVTAYDPNPLVGPVIYSITTSTSIYSNPPEYLNLDSDVGHLYGFVPYQPAYTRSYEITVQAEKHNYVTDEVLTATTVFSLAVKGAVESTIEWVSESNLGSIETDIISELSVLARQVPSGSNIKYRLVSGTLPTGITLERDGSLAGKAAYGSTGTYVITVNASDVYDLSAIEKTFTLAVTNSDNKQYTEIYVKPLLSQDKRTYYSNFINNESIFEPKLMYRYFDPNFGVQHELKVMLEFGIERINLTDYVPALQENFNRKRFYFGEVKTAFAKDLLGNIIYEIVYVDAVDDLVNQTGNSVSPRITNNGATYYPASVDNMRIRLSQLTLPNMSTINVNEYSLPKFMRTAQASDYLPVGYIRVIPLCYTLPGQSAKIVSRIKLSKYDLKPINFDIDRLIVKDSLDNAEPKYLLFPKQTIQR